MNYIANVTALTLDLLDASHYAGEKNEFARKLVGISFNQTLLDLLSRIPSRNRELLEVKLAGKSDLDELYTLLGGYFTEEIVKKELAKKLHGNLNEYLRSLDGGGAKPVKNTVNQLLEETNLDDSLSAVANLLELL